MIAPANNLQVDSPIFVCARPSTLSATRASSGLKPPNYPGEKSLICRIARGNGSKIDTYGVDLLLRPDGRFIIAGTSTTDFAWTLVSFLDA
jgi:hypothetical protein